MADDLELAIVISAVDDASQTFDALTAQAADDFNQLRSDLSDVQEELSADFDAITQSLTALQSSAGTAQEAIAGIGDQAANLETQLTSLDASINTVTQSLDQMQSANPISIDNTGGSLSGGGDSGLSGSDSGLPDLFGLPGAAFGDNSGSQDLLSISQQQLDSLNQLVSLLSTNQSSPVVQNNTFNGMLDSSTIHEQIIPELERAVSRGTTTLF